MVTDEQLLHQAEFQERRQRVVRAMVRLFGGFAFGLAGLFAVREVSPEASEPATAIFVMLLAATGFSYWRTLRRFWRCPACDVRWKSDDVLASRVWNHCALCGSMLRVAPEPLERGAATEPPLTSRDEASLAQSFLRRRRRLRVVAGGAMVVAVAAVVWMQANDWSDLAEHLATMLFVAISVATWVLGSRCPRCELGLVNGTARHCQRCGWVLPAELSRTAAHSPEA